MRTDQQWWMNGRVFGRAGDGFPGMPGTDGSEPRTEPEPDDRPSGTASLTTAVACGVFAAIALAMTLTLGNDVSQCTSGLGQLGQAFGQGTASQCSTAEGLHTIAEFLTITLGAGCLLATWVHLARR